MLKRMWKEMLEFVEFAAVPAAVTFAIIAAVTLLIFCVASFFTGRCADAMDADDTREIVYWCGSDTAFALEMAKAHRGDCNE